MSSYRVGYLVERDLVNKARTKGLIAFGSRGSHSPIDIVIIEKDGTPHFYQIKSTSKSHLIPSDYKKELQEFKMIVLRGVKHFWVRYRGKKKGIPRWLFQWNDQGVK